MIFVLEYQATKGAPWIWLGDFEADCATTSDAWNHLTFLRRTIGLDYYAASVRRKDDHE